MKCLKIAAPHQIRVEELDESKEKLKEDQIKIRINRVSLCGSDIKLYDGHYSGPCRYPLVFGHEWSGEVIEVPEGEEKFQVGDYVTGDCSRWCGECENCKKDKNICSNIEKFGITIDGYSRQIVTAEKKYVYVSKQKLPHKVLALTEPFAVSLHALHSARIEELSKDTKILVIGCGAIGVAAYMFLTLKFGFENVYLTEKNEERRNTMKSIFPDGSIKILSVDQNEGVENEYASVYAGTGFDYIFDASGSVRGLDSAIEYANPFGRISYVGMTDGDLKNTKLITMKKLSIQGSIGGTGEFEEVIRFMEQHQELVAKTVTFEIDYDQAEAAFEEMSNSPSNIKCQIRF